MMLRELVGADLADLRVLWREGLTAFPASFLMTAEEADGIPDASLLSGFESGSYWGVFISDQLVGFAVLRQGGLSRLSHTADLGPFYISADYQRQGVAKALLARVLDQARERGLKQVELCVDQENHAARRLYENAGFRPFGLRPRSVVVESQPRNDVLMLCPLDNALAADEIPSLARQVLD
ncbi:GNAT family N-acetyltransferase [Phaeobacter inhibens]|uniref:GNAT family N-acetyltransferase n=2 Tax=Phaeobacter inhibens TaxID=221822 RepID=UPI000160FA50|nr:GNAT family N-acetyltransferase [Phaeobacter inhibens]AFO86172.1 putative acetyltransferase [Phaeobacter inhibens 2.10]AXT41017.1 GNAT family N-acetyltransferase [Phaeobacter inhibens]UWR68746.1 GNAT family N-acetyltransferase [Phaeobacter inhibens]UWS00411.1 GNAT family N-acetyltransferase [Phaeobacter inhibens]UWS04292.1 GNAT family N-acetyltransferase [Phaeobacter inhibens]